VDLADEVVADKGCHSRAVLLELREHGFRTYISEPDRGGQSWIDQERSRDSVYANRRPLHIRAGESVGKDKHAVSQVSHPWVATGIFECGVELLFDNVKLAFNFGNRILPPRIEKEARNRCREDANESDADDHQSYGNQTSFARDRRHVAITNRCGRHDCPPQCIVNRVDIVIVSAANRNQELGICWKNLVSRVGIEPTTRRLRVCCSAN
jgi:hypothetical protein